VKEYEFFNDRLFKAFEYNNTAYLSFYDEEKIVVFDIKTPLKTKNLTSREAFVTFLELK
jgi:hypothetical protein